MPMHWVKKIVSVLKPDTGIVAEFINEKPDVINKVIKEAGRVDLLQFSGYETPEDCAVYNDRALSRLFHQDEMTVENLDHIFSYKNEYLIFSVTDLVNMKVLREMILKRIEETGKKLIISIEEERFLKDSGVNPLVFSPFAIEIGTLIRKSSASRNVEADKLKFLIRRVENCQKEV